MPRPIAQIVNFMEPKGKYKFFYGFHPVISLQEQKKLIFPRSSKKH